VTDTSRLLLVDDEAQIRQVLGPALACQGYKVRTAADAESALSGLGDWHPHLVVADVYMPHLDGLQLCRRMRAISMAPIIAVSLRQGEDAKVAALDSGADDYVTKPFGVNELLARVRAALRRASEPEPEATVLHVGDFRIDLVIRRVYVDHHEVRLTPKEFELFVYFARHPNRVIEHQRLLEAIWGELPEPHPEYLRVFVGQLRKKLEPEPSVPRYLATEPWVGYRFNPSASARAASRT
jgi:two-component system, OmpR family, KDP operon response regulator KdpE